MVLSQYAKVPADPKHSDDELVRFFRDDGMPIPLSTFWKNSSSNATAHAISFYLALREVGIPVIWAQLIVGKTGQRISLPVLQSRDGDLALDLNGNYDQWFVSPMVGLQNPKALGFDPLAPGVIVAAIKKALAPVTCNDIFLRKAQ